MMKVLDEVSLIGMLMDCTTKKILHKLKYYLSTVFVYIGVQFHTSTYLILILVTTNERNKYQASNHLVIPGTKPMKL